MTAPAFCVSANPATGEEIARFALDDSEAKERILTSAQSGFLEWSHSSVDDRMKCFVSMAAVLRRRSEDLARVITAEMGKPIRQARAEVEKCAVLCDWYAENTARLLADELIDLGTDGHARIAYLPLGVIFAVMPWNFPLWQVLRAAVPIMAAGNGFILKHADNVQGSARALASVFEDAGFPTGAFEVLTIDRHAIAGIIADPRIAAVTATVGPAAGSAIAQQAGFHLKKSLLELGGVDPFVVLADADIERAAKTAVRARFQNTGQVCIAAKRFIVDQAIADRFMDAFVAETEALVIGDPMQEDCDIGPIARHRLRDELHAQVTASVAQGATKLLGGTFIEGPGAYYAPTVLGGVTPGMTVFREETFGPVAGFSIARDSDHAIALANDSEFGLSSSLWTESTAQAELLARSIHTGAVFHNAMSVSDPRLPIGGVKWSGYGRELSHFGLKEFANAQMLWLGQG